MSRNDIINSYYKWMKHILGIKASKYDKVLQTLYEIPFRYELMMDENRADDGIQLRYRFGIEQNIDDRLICDALDDRECSVLEMMIMLCLRVEEEITENSFGDKLQEWFWMMFDNMDLWKYPNSKYNKNAVISLINIMLDREYDYKGTGGLIILKEPLKDLRTVEIWYQMMWYLVERSEY